MREMEYLTEKDLPYFKELAKKGEAVIIYIDPEALLASGDRIGELMEAYNREPAGLSEEKLMAFLQKNKILLSEEARRAREILEENERLQKFIDDRAGELKKEEKKTPVMKMLRQDHFSEADLTLLRRAVEDGFTDDEIRILMSGDLDETRRELVYRGIRARKL